MKKKYFCPHCKCQLNVGNDIIFTAKKTNGEKGLILASQEVGDYSVTKDPLFTMQKGDHLEIICPVCHKNLRVEKINENLAMILMKDEKGVESEIYFSEIYGEHCTYKITNKKKIEMYGEDSHRYNFWGISPNYY
ncbi:MAG: hypothetical protein HY958_07535 [Bacteroidia bacterium]|nr:hypothetical protein [Bacteroidia bacterium]